MKSVEKDSKFFYFTVHDNELVDYQTLRSNRTFIVFTQQLQFPAVRWIHSLLECIGGTTLQDTQSSPFWFTQISQMIKCVVKKHQHCQKYNINDQQHGHLPLKDIELLKPWDEVHVDMIIP